MKPLLLLMAAAALAADKPAAPERQEHVTASREVRVFGIPILKITTKRSGAGTGDPKRGPKLIAVPRDPLAEEIEATKRKK